jgi:hypothetical protein
MGQRVLKEEEERERVYGCLAFCSRGRVRVG